MLLNRIPRIKYQLIVNNIDSMKIQLTIQNLYPSPLKFVHIFQSLPISQTGSLAGCMFTLICTLL